MGSWVQRRRCCLFVEGLGNMSWLLKDWQDSWLMDTVERALLLAEIQNDRGANIQGWFRKWQGFRLKFYHKLDTRKWKEFWERNGKLYLGYWGLKYLKSFVFKFSSREPSQVICLSRIVTRITWWFWMLYVGVRHIRSCNKRRLEEGRQEGSCSHPL